MSIKAITLYIGILVLCVLLAVGCSRIPPESRAVSAAENLGLTHVHVTGRRYAFGALGGCHEDDLTLFKLVGIDAFGHVRHVEVCAPLIGGYTVRS